MAEHANPGGLPEPVGTGGAPAPRPRVLPLLLVHTIGRLAIFALLTVVLWLVGLDFFSGMLFALLLSMPIAYLLLRRTRERLSVAVFAWQEERGRRKADLRTRLSGEE